MRRFFSASLPLALAALASAQTSSVASGTAGSVAGKSSTDSTNTYTGFGGSAGAATISYSTPSGGTSTEDKFAIVSGVTAGKAFVGSSSTNGTTSYGSKGGSTVMGGNTPTYYNVGFSQQVSDTGTPVSGSGGGTYDPWPIRLSDVSRLGSTADLYFQAGLRQSGAFGATGFVVNSGSTASYQFDAYIDTGSVRQNLFSFLVGPTGLSSVSYSAPADFRLALLGSNADDPTISPTARLGRGTSFGSGRELGAFLASSINPDGSLSRDLQFGILRTNFAVPTSGNSSDTLFSWHADLLNRIGPAQATPEPGTVAALGLGAAAFLRRRKRE